MKIFQAGLAACIALLASCGMTTAQVIPQGGTLMLDTDIAAVKAEGQTIADAEVVPFEAEESLPFKKAWRLVVKNDQGQPYNMQLALAPNEPLKTGDIMLMTAWMRTIRSEAETNEGQVSFAVEQGAHPYSRDAERVVSAGNEWRQFFVPFRVNADHTQTKTGVKIRFGFGRQTVEVGGLRLINYGPTGDLASLPETRATYKGREAGAPWRAAAEARIEKYRKADLVVSVVDANGKPVPNAQVEIEQTSHAFDFGCVYHTRYVAGQLSEEPDAVKYREVFARLFNSAVDEWSMKWPGYENKSVRQVSDKSLDWVLSQGIRVRGHTMIWPSWRMTPKDLPSLASDKGALRSRIREHLLKVGKEYAGKVYEWDVVNEPYTHNDILKVLGREEMIEWFKLARQADPNAVLYLNEAGQPNSLPRHERYDVLESDVKMLQAAGAPIGGIGMQGHFGWSLNSPDDLLSIYDRFAKLGLPLKITEFDISVTDEELQADYLRDFMTVSFSHPSINGILLWGFWEGRHWRPEAGLFRKDWTPKPSGRMWMNLVQKKWRTTANGISNADGTFAVRGFHGDYKINVRLGDQQVATTAKLSSAGIALKVSLPVD